MELELKTLNADGSVLFEGKLDHTQVQFILGVGMNYLLTQGAGTLIDEDDDDEDFIVDAPTQVQ